MSPTDLAAALRDTERKHRPEGGPLDAFDLQRLSDAAAVLDRLAATES